MKLQLILGLFALASASHELLRPQFLPVLEQSTQLKTQNQDTSTVPTKTVLLETASATGNAVVWFMQNYNILRAQCANADVESVRTMHQFYWGWKVDQTNAAVAAVHTYNLIMAAKAEFTQKYGKTGFQTDKDWCAAVGECCLYMKTFSWQKTNHGSDFWETEDLFKNCNCGAKCSVCNQQTHEDKCVSNYHVTRHKCCPLRCSECRDSRSTCSSCQSHLDFDRDSAQCRCQENDYESGGVYAGVFVQQPNCKKCPYGSTSNQARLGCDPVDVTDEKYNPCGPNTLSKLVGWTVSSKVRDKVSCTCPVSFKVNDQFAYKKVSIAKQCTAPITTTWVTGWNMCNHLCNNHEHCKYAIRWLKSDRTQKDILRYGCELCSVAPDKTTKVTVYVYEKAEKLTDTGASSLQHGQGCYGKRMMFSSAAILRSNSALKLDMTNEAGAFLEYTNFKVSIAMYDASKTVLKPLDGYPTVVKQKKSEAMNLGPGRHFRITATPIDNREVELKPLTAIKDVAVACGCEYNTFTSKEEQTGMPGNFTVYQDRGMMRFKWLDTSLCEEGFSFYRTTETRKISFTDDYNYASSQDCGFSHEPEYVKDDLKLHEETMEPGSTHQYCMLSVSKALNYRSAATCSSVKVLWEAIVEGKVHLHKLAGELPVKDVEISWKMGKLSGKVTTGGDGKYKIHIKSSVTELAQSLTITPFKKSGNMTHKWKCNSVNPCLSQTVEVNHLDLHKKVNFIDDSSVDFKGAVFVKGTESNDNDMLGCPLKGVEVCLYSHHQPDLKLACTKTNFKGVYKIPIAVGLEVEVELYAPKGNHTFARLQHSMTAHNDPTQTMASGEGVYKITAEKEWSQVDFHDTTSETMYIDVVGGKCNRVLGNSTIHITYGSCSTWKKSVTLQSTPSGQWTVPAHPINIRLHEVTFFDPIIGGPKPYGDVTAFFDLVRTRTQHVDLSNIKKDQKKTTAVSSENTATSAVRTPGPRPDVSADPRKIRFEYHPKPTMTIAFEGGGAAKKVCGDITTVSVPTDRTTEATVSIFEEFLNNIASCDWVEGNITVVNQLGEEWDYVAGMIRDKKRPDFTEEDYELLRVCSNITGCKKSIQLENAQTSPSHAHVKLELMTGRPDINLANNYSKLFQAIHTAPGRTNQTQALKVVVTGDRQGDPGETISIPEYMPLLVLHDPPGGLSYSEYTNVKLQIDMEVEKIDYSKSMQVGFGTWALGGQNTGTCTGLGFAACLKMLAGKVKGGMYKDKNYDEAADYQTTDAGHFELSFSYKTSDKPQNPGKMSDMYLVPALNIQFIFVFTIKVAPNCQATKSQVAKWVLDRGGQNREVFSWVSHADIEKREIPKLQLLLALENNKTTPDAKKVTKLQEGIEGWRFAKTKNDQLYEDAAAGRLDKATSYQDGYYSGLAPEDLINSAKKLPQQRRLLTSTKGFKHQFLSAMKSRVDKKINNPKGPLARAKSMFNLVFPNKDETPPPKPSPLAAVYSLQFSGGGSLLKYKIVTTESSRRTDFDDNIDADDFNKGNSNSFKVMGIGVKTKMLIKYDYKKITKSMPTKETRSSSSVSFALGDSDIGDQFTVDVFVDPVHKTYLFHTHAGISKCPVEPGTKPREKPKIQTTAIRPLGPVEPTAPAIFQLALLNSAEFQADYEFYVAATSNQDDLVHIIDGSRGSAPIAYNHFAAHHGVRTILEVFRGPVKYKYGALKVGFRSKCDHSLKDEVELPIEYLRPCSVVQFAGSLKESQQFIVNHTDATKTEGRNLQRISAFNPQTGLRMWKDDERLLSITPQYRAAGTQLWKPCRQANGTILNLKTFEDRLGYATHYWSVGTMEDGVYDLRLHAACQSTGSTGDGIDESMSKTIVGRIDREPPRQFGATQPARGKYFPGDLMSVSFDEPVQCKKPFSFGMNLTFDGMTKVFNKRNMLVVCEDRKLSITFTALHEYENMMNKAGKLTITRVQDLARNELVNEAISQFTVVPIQTQNAFVTISSFALKKPDKKDPNFLQLSRKSGLFKTAAIETELVALLQIKDPSRVEITRSTHTDNRVLLDITFKPASGADAASQPTTCQLVSKLHEHVDRHDKLQQKKLKKTETSLLAISSYTNLALATVAEHEEFTSDLIPTQKEIDAHRAAMLEAPHSVVNDVSIYTQVILGLMVVVVIMLALLLRRQKS